MTGKFPAFHRFALLLAATILLCEVAAAVAPSLGMILPRGGQRGTDVAVSITGANLTDAADILFYDPGISLKELVAESDTSVKATLSIAPDAPVGSHGLRIRTKTGVTNLQLFSVGALKEINETEPNDDRLTAPPLELNTTVNGVVTAEEVDYFPVSLTKDQRIAVEVEALRLGTILFDPKVRVFDPAGIEVIAEDDTQAFRQDAGVVFTAKEDGVHVVAVNEASFGGGGNYYYRLHVGTFPRPFSVTPLGGQPGEAIEVTWLGDPGIATQPVTVPAFAPGTRALPAQNETGIAPTNLPFRVSTIPGVRETEPNNDSATATPGAVPGAFDGVIGEDGDVDYFSFTGTKGQVFDFRVWARAMGSPLDSVIYFIAPSGGQFASDDDAAGIDSSTRVTLPEDGEHRMYIVDHLKRGGGTFSYRIEATAVEPKLTISTLENRPFSLAVARDNFNYLLVNCSRADFDGPLKLDFLDLPPGVTPLVTEVPAGVGQVPVLFSAVPEAEPAGALAQIQGTLVQEGTNVTGGLSQEIRLIEGANDTTFFGRYEVDRLATVVTEHAPFKVSIKQPQAPFVHNGNRGLVVEAVRAEGFTAAIDLRFPWLPTGMGGGTAQIPAEQNSVEINLEVRGDCPPNTYNLFVAATSSGWSICSPFTPVLVEAPWVAFEVPTVQTDQGKPAEMLVKVNQIKPFEGEFEVTLTGFPKGITCAPIPFNKDTTELKFNLEVTPEAPEGKFEGIVARTAIALHEEPVRHNSGSGIVQVFKPLPAELAQQAPPPAPAPEAGQPEAPKRKTRFPT